MEAQVLLPSHFWLGQCVQLCGLINWFKCQAPQAIAQDQNPRKRAYLKKKKSLKCKQKDYANQILFRWKNYMMLEEFYDNVFKPMSKNLERYQVSIEKH